MSFCCSVTLYVAHLTSLPITGLFMAILPSTVWYPEGLQQIQIKWTKELRKVAPKHFLVTGAVIVVACKWYQPLSLVLNWWQDKRQSSWFSNILLLLRLVPWRGADFTHYQGIHCRHHYLKVPEMPRQKTRTVGTAKEENGLLTFLIEYKLGLHRCCKGL